MVETALVERPGRPTRTRRPTDLPFDLVDEFFYAPCRRIGLFLLNPKESLLVLLVGEPEIEGTVDDQRYPNQRDEQQRIFAQPAFARF